MQTKAKQVTYSFGTSWPPYRQTVKGCVENAMARLATLEASEALTAKHAPTDSGHCRMNGLREMEAIREALKRPVEIAAGHNFNSYSNPDGI